MCRRFGSSVAARKCRSTIATAIVTALLLGLSSSFASANTNFKTVCRPALPSPPGLPLTDDLCRNGGNCTPASATDTVTIDGVVPGDTITFAFTNINAKTNPATVDLMGLGNDDPIPASVSTPFIGATQATYLVQGADGDSVKFQLQIPQLPELAEVKYTIDRAGPAILDNTISGVSA